jgi:hypothetical protein
VQWLKERPEPAFEESPKSPSPRATRLPAPPVEICRPLIHQSGLAFWLLVRQSYIFSWRLVVQILIGVSGNLTRPSRTREAIGFEVADRKGGSAPTFDVIGAGPTLGVTVSLVIDHQLRPLFAFFDAWTLPMGIYANDFDFPTPQAIGDRFKLKIARAVDELVHFRAFEWDRPSLAPKSKHRRKS